MPELDNTGRFRTAPGSYAYAVAIFGVALLVRLALEQFVQSGPFLIFYTAVVVVYLLCGSGPGHVVAVLSALAGTALFMPQTGAADILYAGVFLVSCLFIGWFSSPAHHASVRLREAFARLHREEALHRSTLEAQSDAVIRMAADGTVLYVNEAFCRLLCCVRAQTVGRVWHTLVPGQAEPFSAESLAALSPGNPVVESDQRTLDADGEVRWVHFVNHGAYDERGRLLEVFSVGRDITERKQFDAGLAVLSSEWQDLYDHSPLGHLSLDVDGKFLRVNDTTLRWLGCRREDLIGKMTLIDFLNSRGRHLFRNVFPKLKHLGYADAMQFELCGLDGTVRMVNLTSTTIRTPDDNFLATRSVMNDVTEVERLRHQLAQISLDQSAMLDSEVIAVMKTRERRIVWLNHAAETMLGYSQMELLGQSSLILYANQAAFDEVGSFIVKMLNGQRNGQMHTQMVRKDGSTFWVELSGACLPTGTGEFMWLLTDVTQARLANERIARLAYHDVLTGLPNRLLLRDRLAQAKSLSLREGRELAVCFLDLDGFKAINDLHGHEAGDELLVQVASRLLLAVRANDTVSRLGGDEFVLLLNHLSQPEEHLEILKRTIASLCQPVVLSSGAVVQVTTSVGVSFFPRHTDDTTELIRLADHAMYDAKKAGRNRIVTCQS